MNRLGLFLFFDSEGIVDDYVQYLLDDMMENLCELCIIVNGELTSQGRKVFEKYTDKILMRSNKGFDVGAWKDAMIEEYGFDRLEEYDEVILFNDSFFGPVYPFREMFDEMTERDLDFWAITVHGDAPDPRNLCPYPYRPRYLQLFFLVLRQNFIKSKEFQDYWQNMPYYENFNDVGYKHQAVFTKHFADLGFKWAAYVDTGDLEESVEKSVSFHTYNMYDLVTARRLPVIKRKAFKLPRKFHLMFNSSMDIASTMDYLMKNTDYDVSLIYRYFLRTVGPCELATSLNLKQVISENSINGDYRSDKRVAVILQVNHADSLDFTSGYLKNIPDYIDIIITTDEDDKKALIENDCLSKLGNDSRVIVTDSNHDMSSLFKVCRSVVDEYDYFCFMSDEKPEIDDYLTIRNAYVNSKWDNMLKSPDYINAIIREFDENGDYGLAVPPTPYHGKYFAEYAGRYWGSIYADVEELFKSMKLHTQISRDEYPLSVSNSFWAKSDALKPLFDLDSTDTPDNAFARIYPYVAASQRYYTKTVMTTDYARNELTSYQYMLNETLRTVNKRSRNLVNLKRTFNVYLSTLPKGLINRQKLDQLRKLNRIKQSFLWKIIKPFLRIALSFKKLIK